MIIRKASPRIHTFDYRPMLARTPLYMRMKDLGQSSLKSVYPDSVNTFSRSVIFSLSQEFNFLSQD